MTASVLEQYIELEKPTVWLFPGQRTGRSAQKVLEKDAYSRGNSQAGEYTPVKTFLCYKSAGKLLGHQSVRTTERYTYVSKRNIWNIQSLLDPSKRLCEKVGNTVIGWGIMKCVNTKI